MPRANRHSIPGHVWHITHRCHKQEFLLKFSRDRRRWIHWLYEAKKRFGLCVLNYCVTSNHIHLLVKDTGNETIPRSMQMVAGRVAQEYNSRKSRRGALWEDRYHATAVEADSHLMCCLVYIDLNMVRAGAVYHPSEWPHCGYNEIQNQRTRYRLIDHTALLELSGMCEFHLFSDAHRSWVEDRLKDSCRHRECCWTESVAVGSNSFVADMKKQLGIGFRSRKVTQEQGGVFSLREPLNPYSVDFDAKTERLSP